MSAEESLAQTLPEESQMKSLEWTDERIEKFWNHQSSEYFSELIGPRLLDMVEPIESPILDYGCGSGALMGYLLDRGHEVSGVEVSGTEGIWKRFGGHPRFGYATSPDRLVGRFRTIFLVEVIEHLSDAHLSETLGRIWDALYPGGTLIITTPNDEDLSKSLVYCPECEHEFHRMQHVRSWNSETLSGELSFRGFEVETHETDFSCDLRRKPLWTLYTLPRYLMGRKFPHLLCIARKP